ncbi:MAG: SRPBCC family protein [Deltaproteobacteria bacterium]|nr:SRPBCC family protein [Deltaproteobacteria bacterium]
MMPVRWGVLMALLLFGACARSDFDWAQGEDFLLEKTITPQPDGSVEMHFVSLVNAPGDQLYKAFIDVENHDQFIEGVVDVQPVSSVGGIKKVVDITNKVMGRPNRARIEWTIDRDRKTISFRTLEAPFTDNAAEYHVDASPDGTRARITTEYHLRDKGGHPFPLHLIQQEVIDGYVAAVRSVKRRTLGDPKPTDAD